jgi:hypothetical protein
MKISILILCLFFSLDLHCQTEKIRINFVDATFAVGSSQGSFSLLYGHDWRMGKSQKFGIGIGGRFTTYLGQNQYYETAPAKITSGSTGPGAIFQDNIPANIDSLLVSSPQVNAVNVFISLSYQLTKRVLVGFNIDAIGFSFGGGQTCNYINGATGAITTASPSPFNLLLISDNDLGSLNSELYLKYEWKNRWSIKGGIQFLFTEYTTSTNVQTFPDANDRFRKKSLMAEVGISYRLR